MSTKNINAPPRRRDLRNLVWRFRNGLVALGVIVPSVVLLGMSMPTPASTAKSASNSRSALSIAYGSANNFDCVNDTGVETHGFEIELDDIHSTDISYTYDYNHYGVPKITEDSSDPAHPKVFVRYASGKKQDGSWAAYTAIPSGPINPTNGHQFTDPSVNFGGEHFGVGYNANPTAVKYNWLIDDGTGNLVHGPPVNVATPTFTYYPPAANVVAAIVVPPPPAPPVYEFGDAVWVKAKKTTTHNANKVRLQDLVEEDPGKPDPWANGEPDEVETEWKMLQTKFSAPDGGPNGELQGAPEDLPEGNEVITRRYEFYYYIGPFDAESHEAMATEVGPDGLHGVGTVTYNDHIDPNTGEWVTVTVDLSTIIVVGDFFGAQMSGFDVVPALGMIDNIQNGELRIPYPERRVVIAGTQPFVASVHDGSLPPGMNLSPTTGILSGTPTQIGSYTFTVDALDFGGAFVSHRYTFTITAAGNPGTYNITTVASPAAGGTTTGGGTYNLNDNVTVVATANAGYYFDNWTEGDVHYSFTPSYSFIVTASRDLVANFLVDNVAPTTTATLSGPQGSNGWYVGPAQVTLSATDNASGVLSTFYQLDGGATTTYTGPFMVSSVARHTLVYWSKDKAQNVEATHSVAINLDGTAPSIAAAANPSVLRLTTTKIVTISGTITDALSGVQTGSGLFSTVDSYGLIQPSGSFAIAANGTYSFKVRLENRLAPRPTADRTYTVTVSARDMAGNLGTRSVVITVPRK